MWFNNFSKGESWFVTKLDIGQEGSVKVTEGSVKVENIGTIHSNLPILKEMGIRK